MGNDDDKRSDKSVERVLVGCEEYSGFALALKRFCRQLAPMSERRRTGFLSSSPRIGVVNVFPARMSRAIRDPSICSWLSAYFPADPGSSTHGHTSVLAHQPFDQQLDFQVRWSFLRPNG